MFSSFAKFSLSIGIYRACYPTKRSITGKLDVCLTLEIISIIDFVFNLFFFIFFFFFGGGVGCGGFVVVVVLKASFNQLRLYLPNIHSNSLLGPPPLW